MQILKRLGVYASLLILAAGLGGCDSFNRAIGKEKVIPDEFAVVSRAPLAVPPDFSLRPPRIGAQRPQEVPTVDRARQTVFRVGEPAGQLPPAVDKRSPGEADLLREAGAANANPDIRQIVNSDATSADQMSDSFVDKLAFWRKGQKAGAPDAVIDPVKEAERLELRREQKAGIAPPAPSAPLAGTPSIERTGSGTSSSWLGWLF
jgi:Protein of unknown function (DUF3035)